MKTKPKWQEILATDRYLLEGNGAVLDSRDAERAAMLAYADGLERGINMLVEHIQKEIASESPTLLPLDLPQRIAEELEEMRKDIQGN